MTPDSAFPEPTRRVLVIDDSSLDRQVLKSRLQTPDLEVLEAEDGPSGFEACRRLKPDVILLDLNLPEWNGFETIRRLKDDKTTRSIPVIFLSASTETDEKATGLTLGAVDFVSKPFKAVELRARVNAALRSKKLNDDLDRLANLDGLTGLANRRSLDQWLTAAVRACRDRGWPISVLIVDLDHFKQKINDTHGHAAGDEVLRTAARTLRSTVRGGDFAGRYGGEEFVVVAPDCDRAGALALAERFRTRIAAQTIPYHRARITVTASIGVASAGPGPGGAGDAGLEVDTPTLLARADDALYAAKDAGRNAVWAWDWASEAAIPAGSGRGSAAVAEAPPPARDAVVTEPLALTLTANDPPSREVVLTAPESPRRVLVIDDSELDRRLLKARLQPADFELVEAADGYAGLTLAKELQPKLILLDLHLPGLDGFETIRRLREDRQTESISVIFLSASTSTVEIARGLDLGAVDFVTKPFDAVELRARVGAALRTQDMRERLERFAQIDGLTGVGNRAALDERLLTDWNACRYDNRPLTVLMIDLDHFRGINNDYGHAAGDEVLRRVAQALSRVVRGVDFVGRYGGEEFMILAPGCDSAGALALADRVRVAIGNLAPTFNRTRLRITASVGVATLGTLSSGDEGIGGPDRLRDQADRAMYEAKAGGRNSVWIWDRVQGLAVPRIRALASPPVPPPRASAGGESVRDRRTRRRAVLKVVSPESPEPAASSWDDRIRLAWDLCRAQGCHLSLILVAPGLGETDGAAFRSALQGQARIGDEWLDSPEGVIAILVHRCGLSGVLALAERIRHQLAEEACRRDPALPPDFRIGVAETAPHVDSAPRAECLLSHARAALDAAASGEGGRVWAWDPVGDRAVPADLVQLKPGI